MCLSFDLFLYNMNDSLRDRSVLEIVNRKCCQFTNWKDSEISFIIFIPLFCYFNYLSVSEDVIVIYEVRDAINSLVGQTKNCVITETETNSYARIIIVLIANAYRNGRI